MVVTNLSDFVMDVSSAGTATTQLTVNLSDAPSEPLILPEDKLEVEEQNAAVADWQPSTGVVFLPVGAQLTASSSQAVQLEVQPDPEVSATSRAAELLTAYVADSLSESTVLSYYNSIADCVNDAYNLWNELTSPSPPSAGALMQQALQTIASCEQLRQKLDSDVAAEHADNGSPPDLAAVADHADQDDWQSDYDDIDHVDAVIP